MPEDATTGAVRLQGRLADRDSWTASRCSLDAAVRAVGNRTALLLLREAFYGATRFEEFTRRVGTTDAAASARLRELVGLGVLERRPYREPGQRTRDEYVLTDAGRELLPLALSLMQWGDAHLTGPAGPALRLEHDGCGERAEVVVRCRGGHELALGDLSVALAVGEPEPG